MHNMVNFLILMLLSSILQLLNSTPSVQARYFISRVSFKADLIHRNSPLSPYYYTSMTTQEHHRLGSVSLGHNIRLSSTYFDQNKFKTELIPNGGDYLLKIAIGTPPVEFTTLLDTGSDLLWVQCAPCQRCIQHDSPFFEPTNSSTYNTIPCNSQSCYYPDFDSGCIPNPKHINNNESCVYDSVYGDGTESIGILSTDIISIPSADHAEQVSFPSYIFGCGYDQQGSLGTHGDGIIGLGLGQLSLVTQLGPYIDYKFSYCLTPLSSNVTAKLKFGLDVTGPGVVSTPFTTNDPPIFYSLTLNGIGIGIGNTSIAVSQDIIIDCGTTLTYLPTSVYDSVKTAVKDTIKLSPVPDPDEALDPCYEVHPSAEGFSPPDMVFHFKGADVVLKAANTFWTSGNLTCLAIVPTNNTLLFGNIAQVNFEVGYDIKEKQVSFAPADCAKN